MLTENDYEVLCALQPFRAAAESVAIAASLKNIPNPWATAWTIFREKGAAECPCCGAMMAVESILDNKPCPACEAEPVSAASALMCSYQSAPKYEHNLVVPAGRVHLKERGDVLEVQEAKADAKEHVLNVILITEGLGNLVDRNYYGAEAIQSAPAVFEGVQCMINHQTGAQERERPEGDVFDVCGYFKNLKAKKIMTKAGERWACVGELHIDESEAGKEALAKAKMAIHYSTVEFPGTDKDYVGLSVNAWGDGDVREMLVDGAMMEVNYVTRFVAARSCDIVTLAGRGGKILALVESVAGAGGQNKEVRTMLMKKLAEAGKALTDALAEPDATKREAKVKEAQATIEALQKDLVKAGAAAPAAAPATTTKETDKGADAEKDKKEKEDKERKDKEAAAAAALQTPEAKEAHAFAVKALVKESGLAEKLFDMDELTGMSFREAQKEVARMKRLSEHNAAVILESLGGDVSHAHKITEAAGGAKTPNDDAFAGCTL